MKRVLYIEIYRPAAVPNGFDIRTVAVKRYLDIITPGYGSLSVPRHEQKSLANFDVRLPFMRGYELDSAQIEHIGTTHYDVIIIGSMELANIVASVKAISPGSRIVFDMRDILSRQIKNGVFNSGIVNYLRKRLLQMWEHYVITTSDAVLLLSEDEQPRKGADKIVYVNNGAPYLSNWHTEYPNKDKYRIGFVSDFTYYPNIEGAIFLDQRVAPLLPQHIELTLHGRGSTLMKIDRDVKSVRVEGDFKDISDLYASIDALVAPIFVGSGIKNKVVEGLYAALPVFTTSVGNEGVGGLHGEHLILFKTAEELSQELIRVFSHPATRAALGRKGRQHALGKFNDSLAISRFRRALGIEV